MSDEHHRPMRLAFSDPELERAFRHDLTERSRQHMRGIMVAAALLWSSVALFDPVLAGTDDNLRVVLSGRFGIMPLFAICVAFTFTRGELYRRTWELAGAAVVALVLGTVAIMGLLIPDQVAHYYGQATAGFVIAVVFGYCGTPLRLVVVAVPSLVASALMIVVLAIRDDQAVVSSGWVIIGNVAGIIGSYLIESNRRRTFRFSRMLDAERDRTDRLLKDILPSSIADRLKENRGRIADYHADVTVLFADIVGFTRFASSVAPERVVATLDQLFSQFDALTADHGLEKIKTLGDGYLAVAGLPEPRADHADAAVALAIAMSDAIAEHNAASGDQFALRIGLHTGPVIAGVIGTHKPTYDLWGDTVNVASRMESGAESGGIQLSAATADVVADRYHLAERGTIPVKGKGQMRAYVVIRGDGATAIGAAES